MTGRTIEGVATIHNRGELADALDVPTAERARLTDLALVLRAHERWGAACVEKVLGEFAFVVRDVRAGVVFGARDPVGAAPFYYHLRRGSLTFAPRASAIGEIDGSSLEIDERRVADALVPALEGIDAVTTPFRGVFRLAPGHRMAVEDGRVEITRYWRPEPRASLGCRSDDEYAEAFRAVFTEAVRCRLTPSTAAMLSGGLDSSAIAGVARTIRLAQRSGRLTTVSALTDEPGCEETHHIRSVLMLPGLDSISIRLDEVDRRRCVVESFVESMEEPFDDGMILPLLVYHAAASRGFDAVLDGVDGDVVASEEPDLLIRLLRSGDWGRALREARGFARFYRDTYPPWSSAARLLAGGATRAFTPDTVRAAVRAARRRRAARRIVAESPLRTDLARSVGAEERLMALWESEEAGVAHPHIVAAVERYHRVAASQGIAARHPFLDRRVVEFGLALPWDLRVRGGWSKWVVRQAMTGLLPEETVWRRGRWVRLGGRFLEAVIRGSRGLIEEELSGPLDTLAPYVDVGKVRRIYESFRSGDPGAAETVWTLTVLSRWLRKHAASRYDVPARANGLAAPTRLPVAG